MYIVAIAWLYVTVLMAATERSVIAGLLTLVLYGLAPVALLLWIFGAPVRRRARQSSPEGPAPERSSHVVVSELLSDVDGSDPKQDQ